MTEAVAGHVWQTQGVLKGKAVFLSASKPTRKPDEYRVINDAAREIEEAVLSLARAVFSEHGQLVFGGHPSISPLVASVAAEYRPARRAEASDSDADFPVICYQSKAFEKVIPRTTALLEQMGYARIRWTDAQNGEAYDDSLRGQEQCLESLKHMRTRMIDETKPVAMVAVGGMEGVEREADLIFERTTADVYAIETTGGAAALLRERVKIPSRLKVLENEFPLRLATEDVLPLLPYALLMQKLVRRLGGIESS